MRRTAMHGVQGSRRGQSGAALITVMVMLVVIGLTAAAALRSASSGERFTRNTRLQQLTQQYAEAGLRYCEAELLKSDDPAAGGGLRVSTLAEARLVDTAWNAPSTWSQAASWTTASGGAALSRTVLPQAYVQSPDSALAPGRPPECVVEKQVLADGNRVYVVTARGFSPGYEAEAGTGATRSGAVVWVQSTVLLELGAGQGIRDRNWRRIINPPIR